MPPRKPSDEQKIQNSHITQKKVLPSFPSKNQYEKLHQNAQVSDKFLQVASVTIMNYQEREAKAKKGPFLTRKAKERIKQLIYLVLLIAFFQSSYAKPLKYMLKILPGKINYAANFIQVQQCEVEILAIGKAIISYQHSRHSYPENLEEFIRGSLSSNTKKFGKDPWGGNYSLMTFNDGFKVVSYGPDKKNGTGDEIFNTFSLKFSSPGDSINNN